MGVTEPSSASEWLDSQDDTLTESMLSPELPLAVDLGCSLVGVLLVTTSDPRNSLQKHKARCAGSYKSGIHHGANSFVLMSSMMLPQSCVIVILGKHVLQSF